MGEWYAAGNIDEREFARQWDERETTKLYGFSDLDSAIAKARTLSLDPEEAVVLRLELPPYWSDPVLVEKVAKGMKELTFGRVAFAKVTWDEWRAEARCVLGEPS
jgi:hypothetical protein